MVSDVFDFDVRLDRRSVVPRYVLYAVGQWDYHLMDWRGCNFRRVKIPMQPVFFDLKSAVNWGKEWIKTHYKVQVSGVGQHISDDRRDIDYGIINRYRYDSAERIKNTEIEIKENWDAIRKEGLVALGKWW